MDDLANRFWAKVDVRGPDDCWPWTGALNKGQGRIRDGGRMQQAHRVAYQISVGRGECAGGVSCPHRACMNPVHLEPVTSAENTRRAKAAITHCPAGHEYDDSNTYINRGSGKRQCRACSRAHSRGRSLANA